jgi:hypothetical protein
MWLLRGLDFTAKALRSSLGNKSEELADSFRKAYEGSLKQYHNFVVKGAFSVSVEESAKKQSLHIATNPCLGELASY